MTELDGPVQTRRDRSKIMVHGARSSSDRHAITPGVEVVPRGIFELQSRDWVVEDDQLEAVLRLVQRRPSTLTLKVGHIGLERLSNRAAPNAPYGGTPELPEPPLRGLECPLIVLSLDVA
jgi:hypothetical protein